MDGAPVIETARLRLRGHGIADLDARIAITAQPDTQRFFSIQEREEQWHRIQRYAGHWALLSWGLFAIERGGRFIGEAGLARFERGLGADFDAAPEAAWLLDAEMTGQGLAREAMMAAIDWHARRFGAGRIVCMIDPANTPSLGLAARLGFHAFRKARYRDRPVVLLERLPLAPADEAR